MARLISYISLTIAVLGGTCIATDHSDSDPGYDCRPGQPCWPSDSEWNQFDTTLGGSLYAIVPLAAPCYLGSKSYDRKACNEVATGYRNFTMRSAVYGASEILNWETCHDKGCTLQSLLPGLPPLFSQCTPGRLSRYYVDVTHPRHVSETIKFACQHNIRLSIKNTGHDYFGRSTVPNSLAIWTHHMSNMSYHSDFKASKCPSADGHNIGEIGAGTQASHVYAFFR